jgi:hypothetical protein
VRARLSRTVDAARRVARSCRLAANRNVRIIESHAPSAAARLTNGASLAIEVPGGRLRSRFLHRDPPIAGRVQNDRFTIDVRALRGAT